MTELLLIEVLLIQGLCMIDLKLNGLQNITFPITSMLTLHKGRPGLEVM
jgi:hypothetical protein